MGAERSLVLDRLASNVAKRKSSMPQKFVGKSHTFAVSSYTAVRVLQAQAGLSSGHDEVSHNVIRDIGSFPSGKGAHFLPLVVPRHRVPGTRADLPVDPWCPPGVAGSGAQGHAPHGAPTAPAGATLTAVRAEPQGRWPGRGAQWRGGRRWPSLLALAIPVGKTHAQGQPQASANTVTWANVLNLPKPGFRPLPISTGFCGHESTPRM